jgi:hypothetical protein
MSLDKNVLLNFLKALDDEIDRKITLVAVGGSARKTAERRLQGHYS